MARMTYMYVLWLSELAMRDANELLVQSIWRLYEFSPGFTGEGATNQS